ncbi:Hypothetical_protein [Hexamita inflata]|uniref:Hypothetical_protein n=1 Tax=Hexamita inflata TaxID=28002 RepID=A0AA86VG56_9EUKA|nr:Hypothetical protein HINF_LOCUS53388 [Hexamita inflata]
MYWKQVLQTQTFEVTTELAGHAVHELSEDLQKLFPEQSQVFVLLLETDPTGQVKQVRDPETLFVQYELASQTQILLETVELAPQAVQELFEEEQKLFPEHSQVVYPASGAELAGQTWHTRVFPEMLRVKESELHLQALETMAELAGQVQVVNTNVAYVGQTHAEPETYAFALVHWHDPDCMDCPEITLQVQTLSITFEFAGHSVQELPTDEQKKFPLQTQVFVVLSGFELAGQRKHFGTNPEILSVQASGTQLQTLLETLEWSGQAVQELPEGVQKKSFLHMHEVQSPLISDNPGGHQVQVATPLLMEVWQESALQTHPVPLTAELARQATHRLLEISQNQLAGQGEHELLPGTQKLLRGQA